MKSNSWHLIGEEGAPSRWLVTTAIGGPYFDRWTATAAENWRQYADAHGLGIAVAVADLWDDGDPQLNGAWQKLLAPRSLRRRLGREVRCAVIDTDVFINPAAPDVFAEVRRGWFGVVSQVHGLPLPLSRMNNRIAFLRRWYMDPEFPVESLLNAKPRELFEWAGLSPAFDDFACTGVFVVDTQTHADMLEDWYRSAPFTAAYESVGDWEQTYFNHRAQQLTELQWLGYEWQALWVFEVAAYYPFLYDRNATDEIRSWCVASSLVRNNFLHLAGGWESSLAGVSQIALPGHPSGDEFAAFVRSLSRSEFRETRGLNLGKIMPPAADR